MVNVGFDARDYLTVCVELVFQEVMGIRDMKIILDVVESLVLRHYFKRGIELVKIELFVGKIFNST